MAHSVGKVRTHTYTFAEGDEALVLDSGKCLGPITVSYEMYGTLNADASNAILVLHALSGDAHAAGYYADTDKQAGWWDPLIGPEKPLDTNQYCVICSNVLGGCQGTTGPNTINPVTGEPYGLSFPVITIADMVHVQGALMGHLGIQRLFGVVGGSMGGMQAMEWIIQYPEAVGSAVILAATAKSSPQAIGFDEVGRQAIMSDPRWNQGNYYDSALPVKGLAIARMLAHITYLSDESMHDKFGRRLQNGEAYGYDFSKEFQVESYLHYQGNKFIERFDSNSYLYITKAINYFDLTATYGSLTQAFSDIMARVLVVSFTSDWLFPTYQSREIVNALMSLEKEVSFCEIGTPCGHDAFLLEYEKLGPLVGGFLKNGE